VHTAVINSQYSNSISAVKNSEYYVDYKLSLISREEKRWHIPEGNTDSWWMSPVAVRCCYKLGMVMKWMQYVFWATQRIRTALTVHDYKQSVTFIFVCLTTNYKALTSLVRILSQPNILHWPRPHNCQTLVHERVTKRVSKLNSF